MSTEPKLPQMPEPGGYRDIDGDWMVLGHTNATMRDYGLQCFEAGRQQGMAQADALHALVASSQEIEATNTEPPLPEPRFLGLKRGGLLIEDGWTADQMVTYGDARVAHAAERSEAQWREHFNRAWMDVPDEVRDLVCDRDGGDGYGYLADAIRVLRDRAAHAVAQMQGAPVAWMYEHDGMVHNREHPPLITAERWTQVDEPWSETPLYTSPATAEQPQTREITDAEIDAMAADVIGRAGSQWMNLSRHEMRRLVRAAIALANGRRAADRCPACDGTGLIQVSDSGGMVDQFACDLCDHEDEES